MLQKLFIQHYAIIDSIDISFSEKLNIITGETGAGKSILVGAMGLILGERADSNVLFGSENKCIVEGIFTTDKKSNPENLSTLGLTKNRWGWAINITTAGTTTYPIYAGAGLNNISKGKMVGTLSVSWDGSSVTVTYTMNNGFSLTGTHVYAGDTKPATIAPGQYGNTMSFDPPASSYTGTYNVSDSNGDGIWIIAHAGAFGCY